MATLRSRCGHYILQLWFLSFFFFFSSPILSGRRLDVYHTSTHDVALLRIWNACLVSDIAILVLKMDVKLQLTNLQNACLKCACTQFTENTGRKNYAKNRHLRTIAQLYWAVSSQLRHVSTIGKNC